MMIGSRIVHHCISLSAFMRTCLENSAVLIVKMNIPWWAQLVNVSEQYQTELYYLSIIWCLGNVCLLAMLHPCAVCPCPEDKLPLLLCTYLPHSYAFDLLRYFICGCPRYYASSYNVKYVNMKFTCRYHIILAKQF